jgi:hypothetical protein
VSTGSYSPLPLTLLDGPVNGFQSFTSASTSSSPIDLTQVQDVVLSVTAAEGAISSTGGVTVQLDVQDAAGNWIPAVVTTAALTTTGGTVVAYGGTHTSSKVLTGTGQVTVNLSGSGTPSASGLQISLIGR